MDDAEARRIDHRRGFLGSVLASLCRRHFGADQPKKLFDQ